MPDSTTPADSRPRKPRPDFPLFAHRSGQWCKKIKGKARYFGSWKRDPTGDQALSVYETELPYLDRGEDPPPATTGPAITLLELVNAFLAAKEEKADAGDLSRLTFNGYFPAVERLLRHFGKNAKVEGIGPKEWGRYRLALGRKLAPTTLSTEVAKIKAIFNWGKKSAIHKEVEFGPDFTRSPAKVVRKWRQQGGDRLFTRDEVLAILDAADFQFKAMVTFALNTAFGNADLGALPETALDLDTGWVTFARIKTEVPRRVPLWPETITAIRAWLPKRPKPASKEARGLVFVTNAGTPWVRLRKTREGSKQRFCRVDVLSLRFRRLLERLQINGRRGLNLYALRHVFATVADGAKDRSATDAIMGHIDATMGGNYQHGVSDERLLAVTETVRQWLFGEGGEQ